MFDTVQILGPFNSGTNVMKDLLLSGFDVDIGRKGQKWVWKHSYQLGPRKLKKMPSGVLNIVMVRDPYFWFQSVRKAPYTLRWTGIGSAGHRVRVSKLIGMSGHMTYCPKVFRHGVEKKTSSDRLEYRFDSLISLWNHYYQEYTTHLSSSSNCRVVFVKYEDLIQSPESVISVLSQYLPRKNGVDMSNMVEAISGASKQHGQPVSGRDQALKKLRSSNARLGCYDLRARQLIHLKIDRSLMDQFGYSIIS